MDQSERGRPQRMTLWGILLLFIFLPEAHGFEIRGFGDVNLRKSTLPESLDHNGSFAVGDQIDFFVSMLLTDRIDFLAEMILSEPEEIDIPQRFHVGYIFSERLTVRIGRFHNPLGYWNPIFHHGTFTHTTIERPAFLEFEYEDGILPVHMVGIWTSGSVTPGPLIIEYDFSIANGSMIDHIDPTSGTGGELDPMTFAGDNSRNKAVSFRLQVAPQPLSGLKIMGFGNISTVEGFNSESLLVLKVDQTILGLAAVYTTLGSGLNFLSEYYWIRNRDRLTDLGAPANTMYYIQAGYTFRERLTPYARYEQLQVNDKDPYMTALSAVDNRRGIVGIRYEVTHISALKGEIRRIDLKKGEDFSEYGVQWAFTF